MCPFEPFCSVCGAPVLKDCQDCGARIKGKYHVDGVFFANFRYRPPSFCDHCGMPHPWASRQALLWERENRIALDELSASTRLELREKFEEIASASCPKRRK